MDIKSICNLAIVIATTITLGISNEAVAEETVRQNSDDFLAILEVVIIVEILIYEMLTCKAAE